MALATDLRATEALRNILNFCWSARDTTGDMEFIGCDGFVRAHRLILKAACGTAKHRTDDFLTLVLDADTAKDDVTKVVITGASKDLLTRAVGQVYRTMNPTCLKETVEMAASCEPECDQEMSGCPRDDDSCSTVSAVSGTEDDPLALLEFEESRSMEDRKGRKRKGDGGHKRRRKVLKQDRASQEKDGTAEESHCIPCQKPLPPVIDVVQPSSEGRPAFNPDKEWMSMSPVEVDASQVRYPSSDCYQLYHKDKFTFDQTTGEFKRIQKSGGIYCSVPGCRNNTMRDTHRGIRKLCLKVLSLSCQQGSFGRLGSMDEQKNGRWDALATEGTQ